MNRLLFFVALLLAIPLFGQAQPIGADSLTNGAIEQHSDPVEMWVAPKSDANAVADTFWVHETSNGQFWRAHVDDSVRAIRSPGMVTGHYWTLDGIVNDLTAVQDVVDVLIENGETPALPPSVFEKMESIHAFWTSLDTLISGEGVPGREKPQTYATGCVSTVDNATIRVPPSTTFHGVHEPSVGDTVAVYAPEGACVGAQAWTPRGATMAAARQVVDQGDTLQQGLVPGDEMTVEVYLTETERAHTMTRVTWASCDTLQVAGATTELCEDGGGYHEDGYFQVAEVEH